MSELQVSSTKSESGLICSFGIVMFNSILLSVRSGYMGSRQPSHFALHYNILYPICLSGDTSSQLFFRNTYQTFIAVHSACFMMTSSNGNIFRVTGHLCGEFTQSSQCLVEQQLNRGFMVTHTILQPHDWWYKWVVTILHSAILNNAIMLEGIINLWGAEFNPLAPGRF